MPEKFRSKFEQLIRTSALTGVDQIVCGDPLCMGALFRFVVESDAGLLRCNDCGRVSVTFDIANRVDPARNGSARLGMGEG